MFSLRTGPRLVGLPAEINTLNTVRYVGVGLLCFNGFSNATAKKVQKLSIYFKTKKIKPTFTAIRVVFFDNCFFFDQFFLLLGHC